MKAIETLVAVAIAAGITVVAAEPAVEALGWAEPTLEPIRVSEEHRQQQIQDVVCEANGSPPAECPRIHLDQTVITDEPTTTTDPVGTLPPVTLPKLPG